MFHSWLLLCTYLPLWLSLPRVVHAAGMKTVFTGKVDTHIHTIPALYRSALESVGIKDMPAWTLKDTIDFLNQFGIAVAVLSISTPGVSILGPTQEARTLARALNVELGSYARCNSSYAHRLDFFGTLPDWQDVNGTLAEIDFLYKEQRLCQGVTVFTTYGGKLLGDPAYRPIWQKLQEYKALVFVHPSGLSVKPDLIAGFLPQYVVDFLWSTTRTAIDLVMTGTMAASPDIDVVLAHAGGAVPYVGTRALESLLIPPIAAMSNVSMTQAQIDFARFYYDTALSASAAQLDGVQDFSSSSRLLFGTDYPFAPTPLVGVVVGELATYQATNVRGSQVSFDTLTRNSLALLNKHRQIRR